MGHRHGRRLEQQLAYHQELAELLDLDVDGTEDRLLELRCVQEMAYRLGELKEGRWSK